MVVQQTIEDQQEKLEQLLHACAVMRTPPLTIAAISWTALRHMNGYDIKIQMKGKENLSQHHFSLPGFDLAQQGHYLRDILNGWLYTIEKLETMQTVVPPTLKRERFQAPEKLIASLRSP